MKITKRSYFIFFPVLIIIILLFIWIFAANTNRYDISQLSISPYDNTIVNDYNVTLTASKKDISIASKQFTAIITNDSEYMVSYGYGCQLETLLDGKWYIVPFSRANLIPLVKMSVYGHNKADFPIYLNMFECHPGKHRVILQCSEDEVRTDSTVSHKIILSYEFNLY
jgi:hypothetical protein